MQAKSLSPVRATDLAQLVLVIAVLLTSFGPSGLWLALRAQAASTSPTPASPAVQSVYFRSHSSTAASSPTAVLYAWGDNGFGEIGNGTTTDSYVPITVTLPSDVNPTAIAGGTEHSLAIGSNGQLYAWGGNSLGQLGNGTTTNSNTAVTITLPSGVSSTAIAGGQSHSLAAASNGKLYAWGYNGSGQLGNSTTNSSSTPVTVTLPSGVSPTAMAAGGNHSLVIGSDRQLYAWGENGSGQLGNGTTNNSSTPIVITLSGGVSPAAISTGYTHNLAIGSNGQLYAWGYNQYGQLGNGTTNSYPSPLIVNLPGGITPTAIAAGGNHSLAIGSNGRLYTWGDNEYGQLGNGTTNNSTTPVTITLPVTPTAIYAGYDYSLAIGSNGRLYAWGDNSQGQLGNGTTISSTTPVTVNLSSGLVPTAIYAGYYHTLAIAVPPSPSSLSLSSNPNPSAFGQSVTFTAAVSPITATGTVSFTFDSGSIVSTPLSSGTATYVTSTLSAGSHSVTASYSGDSTYAGATSSTLTQMVNLNSSSVSLTSHPNPSQVGQSVIFTATVSPTGASGTVSFTIDSGTPIVLSLNNGIAIYTTSALTAGSHNVVVTYSGNSTYSDATSNTVTQVVNLNVSSVSLSSSPNPSVVSQTVTFTTMVSPVSANGTVTFSEGATVLGTAPVVSGTAIYPTASLSIGSHVITATYSGNSTYGMAVSQPITQVVQSGCAALVVTSVTDNGSGTNCGTLSYALSQPITGSTPVTITFALTQGNTITFTGSLTPTAKVKSGVTIYGGAFGSTSRIILNGNGVAGDGLHLAGSNYLVNLTIEHFGGRELVLEGTGNRMQGVVVIAI